ncbi:ribosome maturation factor RimM [Caldimonas tepidiphila]|uniref:ribosome maturation factor RimM n=1 Tax=Caldimonas tepidiphila TaxID=2315841 RepID=UPI000E5AC3B4|nr:ribosome maturation factor RimM [Caldimonas tepidiphila]
MSTSDSQVEPSWPEDAVEVGRVLDAWGVKGWIKVQSYSSDPQALFSSRRWFLQPAENRPPVPGAPFPAQIRITAVREHGDGIVASAREIPDRNAAEALRGARIFVSRASFPAAAEDEYYWVDLIGLTVVNREGETLGTVAEMLDTGAHSVLRVLGEPAEAGKPPVERLIPFVGAYIDQVSLPERRITVDWGLDY